MDLNGLPRDRLQRMAEAGDRITECLRVLKKTDDNIVGEVLKGQGTFYEYDHYPPGDVFDPASASQYYYHAHRTGEHGHFHTFLRAAGMTKGMAPVEQSHATYMDEREDKLSHLIAISMDNAGVPIGLFTTNRWVTAENWYAAEDVIAMIDRFEMDMVPPSWPVNIWLTAILQLFQPQIAKLVEQRDRAIRDWQFEHMGSDVFEDRGLEITSEIPISVAEQILAVDVALSKGG
ncbi:hypothetical protein [Magnetospira sp. QH-2]|uniref:DUF6969 family protein n=1 Tax=Magnetospira sp. (strain QH-2) TaxID=1288970 RepID=UPI0005FA9114|nr:hypothetical protein [Magnetospira sp. QH-2]